MSKKAHVWWLSGRSRSSGHPVLRLRRTTSGVLFLFVVIGMTSPFAANSQANEQRKTAGEDIGNPAHGKELFVEYACYQCHGYLGQGGTSAGVRIGPNPLPWQAIAAYIRKPAGTMPPFTSKLLPDRDVQDIYAYLKSVPGPVDLKRIPAFTK